MTDTSPSSAPFRTATAPAPSKAPEPSRSSSDTAQYRTSKSDDDVPPSIYAELEKKPYAVKFFDLDLYHDDPDFAEVKEQAGELNDYILSRIKAQGLKDDQASYKEVVDAIYKQIGRSKNEDPVKALKRLTVAAKAIDRLESAKLPSILSAKTMTPDEYEEVQP